jgi:GTP-binding protein Era
MTRGETQIILMDTPGFHKPRTKLGDYMVNIVHESVADVDATFLLVEPIANVGTQEQELIEQIKSLFKKEDPAKE